jgi:hypothetical protein
MGFSGRQWILMGFKQPEIRQQQVIHRLARRAKPNAADQRADNGFRASRRGDVFALMFGERLASGVECDDPSATIEAAVILPGRHGPMMGIAWAMPPASAERKKPPDASRIGRFG